MADDAAAAYPAHWAADVVLRDGSIMHIRPIRPEDAGALQRFHGRQSAESVYFRFFANHERLSNDEARHFTTVDHTDRVALVLVSGREIMAVGRYDRTEGYAAEVAFTVADALRGRGLGSVLLEHLAAAARERGVRRFVADVLPGNVRMMNVFRDAGYEVHQVFSDGVVTVSFDIDPTERSLAVMAEREQHADAESMRGLLGATSVLVLAEEGRVEDLSVAFGRRAAEALLASPFEGAVHLVGAPLVDLAAGPRSARAYCDVELVPRPVDLAVLAALPERLPALVRALCDRGVHGVVILSGGTAGRQALRVARDCGVRLVGPKSFGLVGSGPAGRFNVTLRTPLPPPGGLGLFCHSAAAGIGLLAAVERRGLGLDTFLSAGHRTDVSGNDAMQFWIDHPGTDVVCVYLESIGNPRKFSRVARRLAERKPVIAAISAQTGHALPPGHSVRTSAEPARVLEEMLRQAGVIHAASTHQMLDVAALLESQPPPAGPRVGVLTNSGSLANLLAELARERQLEPVEVRFLASGAEAAAYADALAQWAARKDWDALVVGYVPALGVREPGVCAALAAMAARSSRPVLGCVFGLSGLTAELTATAEAGPEAEGQPRTVPAFATVEDAVAALALAVGRSRWVRADRGRLAERSGIDHRAARDRIARLMAGLPRGRTRSLPNADVAAILECYGVHVWPAMRVAHLTDALAAARELGWPVAVKTRDPHLRHRLDLGGVRLDVSTADGMRDALGHLAGLTTTHQYSEQPYEVQAMAPRGVACVLRAVEDDLYGPVVSFGLAGDATELLEDVAYRIPPLTDGEVAEMVRSVRAAPRLLGHRGLPPSDVAALEDVVSRVAMLKDDLPEVASLLINPVVVGERGAAVLEAQMVLGHPGRQDLARRVLPAMW